MKALITGGAGFIGSALARHAILACDWRVLVVDKLTYAGHRSTLASLLENPGFEFLHADICDRSALDAAFGAFEPDIVFHLAAESHVDRSIADAGAFIETNIVGTFSLLQAARAYWEKLERPRRDKFRFLHVSTDEVFGSLGADGLFEEATPYDPRSPYSASKAAADHLVRAWGHTYGLPTMVSNCSNNYGPYQLPEKLIPLTILNALDGLPLPIYGDGSNVRDWLYVEDHVEALCLIAQKGLVGRSYNVGGRNERTNLAVVGAICDVLDRLAPRSTRHRELMTFVADRPGHDQRYAIDAGRLENELGWRARETFETGLEKTIAWYMAHPQWWGPLRDTGVGRKRLGLIDKSAN